MVVHCAVYDQYWLRQCNSSLLDHPIRWWGIWSGCTFYSLGGFFFLQAKKLVCISPILCRYPLNSATNKWLHSLIHFSISRYLQRNSSREIQQLIIGNKSIVWQYIAWKNCSEGKTIITLRWSRFFASFHISSSWRSVFTLNIIPPFQDETTIHSK